MADFSKIFAKYKRQPREDTRPSNLIPLEIERWNKYRDLVSKRGFKALSEDKEEFINYLTGDTFPMARAYESHPLRNIKLNPTYDPATKSFPLWENIYKVAMRIGTSYDKVSVRAGLRAAIKELVTFLESIDLNYEDSKVKKFESKLQSRRKFVSYQAIITKTYLKGYPQP
jgi:hypothetical protein